MKLFLRFLCFLCLICSFTPFLFAQYDPTQHTNKHFPVSGNLNALIVFVQFSDDVFEHCALLQGYDESGKPQFQAADYATHCKNRVSKRDKMQVGTYQSWTDDPHSEWRADLPKRDAQRRELPHFAKMLIDAPNGNTLTRGSLSEFYAQMSNGKFGLRGNVYPFTYIPQHPISFYQQYYQNLQKGIVPENAKFPNGASLLSHEILSYVRDHPHGIDFSKQEIWDRYTNGDGKNLKPDGKFDMLVLVSRFGAMPQMSAISQNNVTSLGAFGYDGNACSIEKEAISPFYNAFGCHSLKLGNLEVVDNLVSGSGVLLAQQTRRNVVRMIAHEIGHRQFFYAHTESVNLDDLDTDHWSMMNGNHEIGLSAWDRILLNWANVQEIDVRDIPKGTYRTFTLPDVTRDKTSPDVLWLKDGKERKQGDLLIEARFRSTSQDCAPRTLCNFDDGDGADYFLPDEGLYFYKTPPADSYRASSLPNGGTSRRKRGAGVIQQRHGAFYDGDALSPFSEMPYQFWQSALDQKIAITHIQRDFAAKTVRFRVWHEPPASVQIPKTFSTRNAQRNFGRIE